jgi:1,2-diacylglycerol 3-alpha-glucosyltransferase
MNILHICLAGRYAEGYSYQDNLLSKYHKKTGHDVSIVASLVSFDKTGRPCLLDSPSAYVNENGIPVQRIGYKPGVRWINQKLRRYDVSVDKLLESKDPDYIFIHGLQFLDILKIIKYKKVNPKVRILVDNHADFSNSAQTFLSRWGLHGIVWKYCAKRVEPYVEKFFGVLPARCDFLHDVYGLPKEKIDLLLMGADDEYVDFGRKTEISALIRKKHNVADDDFLIVSGGKLDKWKNIPLLLEGFSEVKKPKIKLLIFGNCTPDMNAEIESLASKDIRVQLVGWIDSKEAYHYFLAADLIVFPGRHSVLWEQAVACGVPSIFKSWQGTQHVDIGGNCQFLYKDSEEEIRELLERILTDRNFYLKMQTAATSQKREDFLYSKIARKSLLLEC